MFKNFITGVFIILFMTGCETMNSPSIQSLPPILVEPQHRIKKPDIDGDWVWVEGEIETVYVGPKQEGNRAEEGHYVHIKKDGHWALRENVVKRKPKISSKESGRSAVATKTKVGLPINVPSSKGQLTREDVSSRSPIGNRGLNAPFCIVELKTGEVITGKLMEETDQYVRIHLMGLNKDETYYYEDIKSINQSDTKASKAESNYVPLSGDPLKKKLLEPSF